MERVVDTGDVMEELRAAALRYLAVEPTQAASVQLISWLDQACIAAEYPSLAHEILTRAVIAVGYLLRQQVDLPTVTATIAAAELFVREPNAEHYAAYQYAATNSYPYGAGDGCYAIAAAGYPGCQPGSGCISGAGSLLSLGLDDVIVMQVVANELLPWLRGEEDPVDRRWRDRSSAVFVRR